MGCFSFCSSKTQSSMKNSSSSISSKEFNPSEPKNNIEEEIVLEIPRCRVHLVDEGEAVQLAIGEFTIIRIFDENVSIATIVKVGDDLRWPLTKDEPVVKIDSLHYLFSLPMTHGDPLSYGVTFIEEESDVLNLLDSFLEENSCFSGLKSTKHNNIDWKEFAPRVEDYNNFLARAIAGGTGQIVKGIFKCSNAYSNQVQKGGEITLTNGTEGKKFVTKKESFNNHDHHDGSKKQNEINKSLKRVRKLTKMTEKISKTMLNGVGIVTGTVMAPVVKSQAGKSFLTMIPGEILLASLDAVNKVLDAAEAAEKQSLSATSSSATRMVSNRFGESAGEATGDVLATAGHFAGTAWNVIKIRKAFNPASSVSTGVLKNTAKSRSTKSTS